jgi:hypothetical protein
MKDSLVHLSISECRLVNLVNFGEKMDASNLEMKHMEIITSNWRNAVFKNRKIWESKVLQVYHRKMFAKHLRVSGGIQIK